ncbi:hypothetical protein B0H17DRAFT_1161771 [Mycena rosella]|uniref:Uncharacterized protein n=1 Tax=Mycena rosella TaxID=1033263 RepID=A0AAD7D1S3_MYCRO|nr:hypothetical protein B0H17DRAFT_1161771 [Mycena rosella]
MPVPKSVLDDCEASFTAANDKWAKSSTQFFDDTALMGLNCRHDHLLFLVNMKTAGEKQFYMYVLLEMFLRHLPQSFVVGFLYDIACQLERLARKWGFLPPEYLARLQFSVLVLHAFGHHWVCQMIYHLRRRTLFGLTDGEGCERFWHSISKLIAYLRVCGYHRRIYTLDSQILHLQKASIRRHVLRREYAKQLKAQTKPLPILKGRVKDLEDNIADKEAMMVEINIAEQDLGDAKTKLKKAVETQRCKEVALGVDNHHVLRNIANSPYIQACMNARALKHRLRDKLQSRKFELDRVEWTFHQKKTAADPKLKTHIEDAVRRWDPSIQELLIRQHKAPRNAVPPTTIDPKSIWGLDIDDEIWQDVGLDNTYDDKSDPLLWLKNEGVREGIKAMLEKDRCNEEAPRVFHECCVLWWWLSEEWEVVGVAMELAAAEGDLGVVFQLELRRHKLCQLCAGWNFVICSIPFSKAGLPGWGPTEAELLSVRIEDVVAKSKGSTAVNEEDWSAGEEDEEDKDLPINEIKAFQRGGVYAEEREEYYRRVKQATSGGLGRPMTIGLRHSR